MSDELLDRLNPEQRDAVTWSQGPLLILAGAGSGKTRVLTHRIAWLLREGLARPWEILAVTFTNKAAGEMKSRVAALAPGDTASMWVSTFHSACLRLLRRHADRVGYGSDFVIYDTDDQHAVLKRVCKDLRLPPDTNLRAIAGRIDQAKNRRLGPEELDQRLRGKDGVPYGEVYRAYQAALKANNACDFNDLIGLVIDLLEADADLRAHYQATFRHLLVDEYQDTNHAQYRLVTLLGKRPEGAVQNVAVVGDDDQSIYSFRGADIRNILDFERDFPGARTVRLERNYRSTQAILGAASAVVARNRDRKGKTLWTERAGGTPVELRSCDSDQSEGRRVADTVRELLGQGFRPSQVAIFYRANAQSRVLEEALRASRLPFVIVGGQKFFERKEIKDAVAWLRILANPADDVAFERAVGAPPRGIGDTTLDLLRAQARSMGLPLWAAASRLGREGQVRTAPGRRLVAFVELLEGLLEQARRASLPDLLREVYARSGVTRALAEEDSFEARQRLENLDELLNQATADYAALPPPEGLREFLDRNALRADVDDMAPEDGTDRPGNRERITLMTVHCSKGLEYPAVLVAGMDEGVFPHQRSLQDPQAIEEERRLCYVAFTRAEERLILFRAARRMVAGTTHDARPSRFLRDIPPSLLVYDADLGGRGRTLGTAVAPTAPQGRRVEYDEGPRPGSRGGSPDSPPGSAFAVDREPRVVRDTEGPLAPGVRVRHPQFGVGEIHRVEGTATNPKVTVFFRDAGRKEIYVRYTSLEVLS